MFQHHDPEEFHATLVAEMRRLGLVDTEVARALGVNQSTVNRWRHGLSTPQPALRGPVLAWLAAQPTRKEQ